MLSREQLQLLTEGISGKQSFYAARVIKSHLKAVKHERKAADEFEEFSRKMAGILTPFEQRLQERRILMHIRTNPPSRPKSAGTPTTPAKKTPPSDIPVSSSPPVSRRKPEVASPVKQSQKQTGLRRPQPQDRKRPSSKRSSSSP